MRIAWWCRVWTMLLLATGIVSAAEIRGRVVDARGEALARVRVLLLGAGQQTVSDSDGRFAIPSLAAGEYTVQVETVGYRLLTRTLTLGAGEITDLEIVLSPDAFRRTDSIEVHADPFDLPQSSAPSGQELSHNEIKDLGTVLVDDPLRAVQSLPGVVANNDFYSQFSVYGAPASTIGLYLDGILLHAPYHTIEGMQDAGSVSILNGDSIESLALLPVAFPSRYHDRTGSALDIRSREGSRNKSSFRGAATVAQANLLAEGPWGSQQRGTWLMSARKSYAQYIAGRLTDDPAQAFGFTDGQARVTYDLTPHQSISLHGIETRSDYDRSSARSRLGVNSLLSADYHITMGRAGWRWTPSPKALVDLSGAWMREKFENLNRDDRQLGRGVYGEWVGAGSASWFWHGGDGLEFGWNTRRLRAEGAQNQYLNTSANLRLLDRYRATALRQGGYAQQSWSAGRLRISGGLRWDAEDGVRPSPVTPQASASWHLAESTHLRLGWGTYVQFPDLTLLGTALGGFGLLPERERHTVASLEQRLGTRARVRVEAFQREHRDRLARPFLDPRLVNGRIVLGVASPLWTNSVRGYVRGTQILIQNRDANRISGWISYTLQYARERDGLERTEFWSLDDQRHTLNAHLGYRWRPSVHFSGKFVYGTGNPVPGFVTLAASGLYYLAPTRNDARLNPYSRLDLRVNKSFVYTRAKLTLYGELINSLNHANPRFTSFDGVDNRTARAYVTIQKAFPIFPSGGIMFEF